MKKSHSSSALKDTLVIKNKNRFTIKESHTAWLFITPYLIGYLIFHFLPIAISFIISFTDIRFISNISNSNFIGLKNYFTMFQDHNFINALKNSLLFTVMYVPIIMIIGLTLAILVNQKIHARSTIRGMIFMPYVSNMVAIAVVWSILLDPLTGPVNSFLRSLGIQNVPSWLMSTDSALFTVVLISVWQSVGLQFITYLAGLQGVPTELKEAATIDGANKWQVFLNVTHPCLLPTTFLLTITSVITSFKNFTVIKVLTEGGPGTSTTVLPLNVVNTAFSSFQMGYASAQAMIMFVIVMLVTIVQWKVQSKYSD